MDLLKISWASLVILVLSFLLFNIIEIIKKIKKEKKDREDLIWSVLSLVLLVFLTSFGAFMLVYLEKKDLNPVIPIIALGYFLSALFVLFIIKHSHKAIFEIKNKQKNFANLNIKLEYEAMAKSKELEEKINELENTRTAMLNLLEDITSQKNELVTSKAIVEKMAIEVKKTNEELIALDKQKDQFTSISAHELKTPLASIHGFAQLLQNKKISEDPEKRGKYLKIILEDTERLTKLVTDILDISKIDLGTLKFYLEKTAINDIIESIERQMTPLIKEKNIISRYEVLVDPNQTFMVDKIRIMQVLSNLMINAVHYTDKGEIRVCVKKDEENILFSISDTGSGIPKDAQAHLFTKFYQADSWMTRKVGGSGLGLAISKGIISALGGKIWFESKEGEGTTFYFTIPIAGSPNLKVNAETTINLFENNKPDEKESKKK